jgi:hypothetical protein
MDLPSAILLSLAADTVANVITGKIGDLFNFNHLALEKCKTVITKQKSQYQWDATVFVHQYNDYGDCTVKPLKITEDNNRYITREEFEDVLKKVALPDKKKKKKHKR